jgi:tRNA(Phe) wybutosine-synthesizing methylase Tyw3
MRKKIISNEYNYNLVNIYNLYKIDLRYMVSKVKLVKKDFTNFLFGVAASCLQSLSKQLKRMEALYRNVRLPESVRGKGG